MQSSSGLSVQPEAAYTELREAGFYVAYIPSPGSNESYGNRKVYFPITPKCYLFLNPFLLLFSPLRCSDTVKKNCDYKSESALQKQIHTQIKFITYVFIHLLLWFSFLFKRLINFPFNKKKSVECKYFLPRGFSISFLRIILSLATESESKNPEEYSNVQQVKYINIGE